MLNTLGDNPIRLDPRSRENVEIRESNAGKRKYNKKRPLPTEGPLGFGGWMWKGTVGGSLIGEVSEDLQQHWCH